MGFAYSMPSFASFSEMLMHEQGKLISMGLLNPSQSLVGQPKGQKSQRNLTRNKVVKEEVTERSGTVILCPKSKLQIIFFEGEFLEE
jgi:hypothetical protein